MEVQLISRPTLLLLPRSPRFATYVPRPSLKRLMHHVPGAMRSGLAMYSQPIIPVRNTVLRYLSNTAKLLRGLDLLQQAEANDSKANAVADALHITSPLTLQDFATCTILSEMVYKMVEMPEVDLLDKLNELVSDFPMGLIQLTSVQFSRSDVPHQYLMGESGNRLYVAFMGTKRTRDLGADVNFRQEAVWDDLTSELQPQECPAAHKGFLYRASTMDTTALLALYHKAVVDGKHLVLCGHSLGAAVATLCTLRLLRALPRWPAPAVSCLCFAAPAVGNTALAKLVHEAGWSHFFNYYFLPDDGVMKLVSMAQQTGAPYDFVRSRKHEQMQQIQNSQGLPPSVRQSLEAAVAAVERAEMDHLSQEAAAELAALTTQDEGDAVTTAADSRTVPPVPPHVPFERAREVLSHDQPTSQGGSAAPPLAGPNAPTRIQEARHHNPTPSRNLHPSCNPTPSQLPGAGPSGSRQPGHVAAAGPALATTSHTSSSRAAPPPPPPTNPNLVSAVARTAAAAVAAATAAGIAAADVPLALAHITLHETGVASRAAGRPGRGSHPVANGPTMEAPEKAPGGARDPTLARACGLQAPQLTVTAAATQPGRQLAAAGTSNTEDCPAAGGGLGNVNRPLPGLVKIQGGSLAQVLDSDMTEVLDSGMNDELAQAMGAKQVVAGQRVGALQAVQGWIGRRGRGATKAAEAVDMSEAVRRTNSASRTHTGDKLARVLTKSWSESDLMRLARTGNQVVSEGMVGEALEEKNGEKAGEEKPAEEKTGLMGLVVKQRRPAMEALQRLAKAAVSSASLPNPIPTYATFGNYWFMLGRDMVSPQDLPSHPEFPLLTSKSGNNLLDRHRMRSYRFRAQELIAHLLGQKDMPPTSGNMQPGTAAPAKNIILGVPTPLQRPAPGLARITISTSIAPTIHPVTATAYIQPSHQHYHPTLHPVSAAHHSSPSTSASAVSPSVDAPLSTPDSATPLAHSTARDTTAAQSSTSAKGTITATRSTAFRSVALPNTPAPTTSHNPTVPPTAVGLPPLPARKTRRPHTVFLTVQVQGEGLFICQSAQLSLFGRTYTPSSIRYMEEPAGVLSLGPLAGQASKKRGDGEAKGGWQADGSSGREGRWHKEGAGEGDLTTYGAGPPPSTAPTRACVTRPLTLFKAVLSTMMTITGSGLVSLILHARQLLAGGRDLLVEGAAVMASRAAAVAAAARQPRLGGWGPVPQPRMGHLEVQVEVPEVVANHMAVMAHLPASAEGAGQLKLVLRSSFEEHSMDLAVQPATVAVLGLSHFSGALMHGLLSGQIKLPAVKVQEESALPRWMPVQGFLQGLGEMVTGPAFRLLHSRFKLPPLPPPEEIRPVPSPESPTPHSNSPSNPAHALIPLLNPPAGVSMAPYTVADVTRSSSSSNGSQVDSGAHVSTGRGSNLAVDLSSSHTAINSTTKNSTRIKVNTAAHTNTTTDAAISNTTHHSISSSVNTATNSNSNSANISTNKIRNNNACNNKTEVGSSSSSSHRGTGVNASTGSIVSTRRGAGSRTLLGILGWQGHQAATPNHADISQPAELDLWKGGNALAACTADVIQDTVSQSHEHHPDVHHQSNHMQPCSRPQPDSHSRPYPHTLSHLLPRIRSHQHLGSRHLGAQHDKNWRYSERGPSKVTHHCEPHYNQNQKNNNMHHQPHYHQDKDHRTQHAHLSAGNHSRHVTHPILVYVLNKFWPRTGQGRVADTTGAHLPTTDRSSAALHEPSNIIQGKTPSNATAGDQACCNQIISNQEGSSWFRGKQPGSSQSAMDEADIAAASAAAAAIPTQARWGAFIGRRALTGAGAAPVTAQPPPPLRLHRTAAAHGICYTNMLRPHTRPHTAILQLAARLRSAPCTPSRHPFDTLRHAAANLPSAVHTSLANLAHHLTHPNSPSPAPPATSSSPSASTPIHVTILAATVHDTTHMHPSSPASLTLVPALLVLGQAARHSGSALLPVLLLSGTESHEEVATAWHTLTGLCGNDTLHELHLPTHSIPHWPIRTSKHTAASTTTAHNSGQTNGHTNRHTDRHINQHTTNHIESHSPGHRIDLDDKAATSYTTDHTASPKRLLVGTVAAPFTPHDPSRGLCWPPSEQVVLVAPQVVDNQDLGALQVLSMRDRRPIAQDVEMIQGRLQQLLRNRVPVQQCEEEEGAVMRSRL